MHTREGGGGDRFALSRVIRRISQLCIALHVSIHLDAGRAGRASASSKREREGSPKKDPARGLEVIERRAPGRWRGWAGGGTEPNEKEEPLCLGFLRGVGCG